MTDRRVGVWAREAACRGRWTGDWYRPPDSHHRSDVAATNRARAICEACPVKAECLDHAMRLDERHGLWGGLDERERDALRRGRPPIERLPPPVRHGTANAYTHRGCRCQACREANRLAAEVARDRRQTARRVGRPRSAEHGTRTLYNAGCRCEACRDADRAYNDRRRPRDDAHRAVDAAYQAARRAAAREAGDATRTRG